MRKNYCSFECRKVVVLFMCLLFFPLVSFAATKSFTVGDLTYLVRGDGDVTVASCNRKVEGNIDIPRTVEYGSVIYKVVWIGGEAFDNIPKLTSISIPESVMGVSTPYYDAFYNLPALEKITVADGNEGLESRDGVLYKKGDTPELIVFPKCAKGTVNILEGLDRLVLKGYLNITSLVLPASLTSLSLTDCTALTSLKLPVAMADFTASGCISLSNISVADGNRYYTTEDGVLYYKDTYSEMREISFFPVGKSSYTLPADVNLNSNNFLFAEISDLKSLSVVPEHSEYASEANAIYAKEEYDGGRTLCDVAGGLPSFNLPTNVNNIRRVQRSTAEDFEDKDFSVLELVTGLKTLTVAAENAVYFAKDNILYQHSTDFDLGEVVSVACAPLSIQGAVTIPDEVTLIDQMAFFGHEGITSLTLPANVMLEYAVFANCSSLSEVIFKGHADVSDNAFANTPWFINHEPGVIYAGTTAIDLIGSPSEITLKEGTTAIGGNAFYYGSSLVKITLPAGITKIGGAAFYNCSQLKEINFPASLVEIEEGAFGFCKALTNVHLEDGLTFLPKVFDDMAITSIDVPASVIRWFENFSRNEKLTEIRVAESNPEFVSVDGIVYTKDKTKVVAVPGGKKEVTLVEGMTGFYNPAESPDYYYYGNIFGDGVEKLTLPASLKEIPPYTFGDCYNLKSCSVISRDPIAFEGYDEVFPSDLSNTILYVPVGCKSVYEKANEWKRFGQIIESDNVGISNAEMDIVQVEVIDGGLFLSTEAEWQVYSPTGSCVATGKGDATISLPAGLYLLKAGNTIKKVIVK